MVRKPVRRGPRAGLEMWGCTRWPDCSGVINIDQPTPTAASGDAPAVRVGVPGAYGQRQFERERERDRARRRALLPLAVAFAVIAMVAAFLAVVSFAVWIASLVAILVGLGFMALIVRMPADSIVWAKGVEGERLTAKFLEPLLDAGFVVMYGRQIPGGSGDIDSIVIGPTGVFPIETKNWSGRFQVKFDRLLFRDQDKSWVVKQIYREALAVQVALGEELTARRVTVTPILCAVSGVSSGGGIASGVHVVDGKGLARLIADRPTVFDDEAVQQVARLADQRLHLPYEWQVDARAK